MFTIHRKRTATALLVLLAALTAGAPTRAGDKVPVKVEYKGWFSNPVFSPDGKTLIYAQMAALPYGARTTTTQIVLWNVADRKEIRRIDGPSDDSLLGSIALAPDGKRLALCVWNTALRIWDLEMGKELGKPAGSQGAKNLCFSADSKSVGWLRGGDIHLADAATAKEFLRIAKDADGPAITLAFVGKNVITGYSQSKVIIPGGKNPTLEHQTTYWVRDGASGEKLRQIGEPIINTRKRFDGPPPNALYVSAHGEKVVLADGRGFLHVYATETGKKEKELAVPWKGQAHDPSRRLTFSSDLRIAATTSGGMVTTWDLATGEQLHRLETGKSFDQMVLSPDGNTLAATHQTPGQVGAVLLIYGLSK